MKPILAAAIALSLAACAAGTAGEASTPAGGPAAGAQAAAVNPVGTFEFTTMVNGASVNGTLEVMGSPGAYTGRLRTSILPEMPVSSASVSGQEMTVLADAPDGTVTIRMTFTGDTFTGSWALGGDGGALSGRRTR
jgi:hypothetical protein